LLEGLRDGDRAAAERLLTAYGPYLRTVIRRQLPQKLRAKLDSADVLQSVWAALVPGFRDGRWSFDSPEDLRAFLAQVTRRRLSDRLRHHRAALEREQPLEEAGTSAAGPSAQPRPSEWARAGELWDSLLAACPPEHHELLRLRRQGLSLAEIAAHTGLHEGSVRRVLRRLARCVALDVPPAGA